ncbi:hypothetical protein KAR48_20270 [bacterium]|nr:hypothetical protein [bacterium]
MGGFTAILPYLSAAASVAGTVMSAKAQNQAAADAKNIANINATNAQKLAEYNASIDKQAAGQEEAASQLRAREIKRQSRLKQSRVLALAAASGGGAMDMDVLNTIAGFEEEGDLAASTELYQGSESSRKLQAQGKAGVWQGKTEAQRLRYEGSIKSSALKSQSKATVMGGASSLASKYGAYANA